MAASKFQTTIRLFFEKIYTFFRNIHIYLHKVFRNIYLFYRDGFKNMTVGKTLWIIILVKLFIMFAILKVFFFPNLLKEYKTQDEKANHVVMELLDTTNNQKK